MRHRVLLALAALVSCLVMVAPAHADRTIGVPEQAAVGAANANLHQGAVVLDPELEPGLPPPGLAVKVFVHYPTGHGPGTDVVSAPVCDSTDGVLCEDYAIATTSSGPIRWAPPGTPNRIAYTNVPYYIMLNYSTSKSPTLAGDAGRNAARAAIDAAFGTWEAASDADLKYTYKGSSGVPIPRLDGKNVVGWKALQPGAIAVTYVWYYTATGYIAEFDMIFNNSYAWTYTLPECAADGDASCNPATYEDPTNSGVAGTFDVRDIGTHEAGHTLMLLDLYNPSQANLTMYGYGAYRELIKDTLALGDDLGVDYIY